MEEEIKELEVTNLDPVGLNLAVNLLHMKECYERGDSCKIRGKTTALTDSDYGGAYTQ